MCSGVSRKSTANCEAPRMAERMSAGPRIKLGETWYRPWECWTNFRISSKNFCAHGLSSTWSFHCQVWKSVRHASAQKLVGEAMIGQPAIASSQGMLGKGEQV